MNKQSTILTELKKRSINRFEAEKLGDHCLHSTVSNLRKRGHNIEGYWEPITTRFGNVVRVKRYYIPAETETATKQSPTAI